MRSSLRLEELDARDVPAVLYVAPTGSDLNAGTAAAPWQTLQHAADTVVAGDQVIVKAGTYVGFDLRTDGTAAAPIKFSAQLGVVVNAPNPRTGVDGINVEGADFAIIDGFKVANQSRTGIRVVGGTGDTVSRNVVYGTVLGGNAGIFLDGASSARVQNNLVYNNHSAGIALAQVAGATGSVNAVVVNNTVSVPTDGGWALDISGGSTGATVFNNILQTAHATRGALSITTDSLLAFVSDYNTVADRFSADGGATVKTLAQWQAATGQDAHSVIGTVASTFVSPGANNYQLSMLSPARDMGKSTFAAAAAPATDIRLVAPTGAYDAGAYQMGVATLGAPTFLVNAGSSNRSIVRSISMTFGSIITYDATAFSLARSDGVKPAVTITRADVSGKTTLTFTFTGAGTDVGSLADGIWNLNVTASGVQLSGHPEITLASNYRFTFHRLFGDGDSDRDVDFLDQRMYTAAVGKTDSTNLSMFDFNNDGRIDAIDTTEFTSRIGKRV